MNKLLLSSILISLLIVLSGLGLAEQNIESLDFKTGMYSVTHILPLHVQNVDIMFNMTSNETITSVIGDLSEVNPDPSTQLAYKNRVFSCTETKKENISNYFCKTNSVTFIPQDKEVSMTFKIITIKNTTNITYNKTFEIDNTNPQVKRFETEFCEKDKCYLPHGMPTKLYFSFDDSLATFYQEKVFYTIAESTTRRVTSCNGTICEGLFTDVDCNSGDYVQAKILTSNGVPSSDDAGNIIQGELKKSFLCDVYAPGEQKLEDSDETISYNLTHTGGAIYPNAKSGDSITLTITISEDASGVTAYGNFTDVGGSVSTKQCEQVDGSSDYQCEFTISNVKSGEHIIPLTFVDGVGREFITTYELEIDQLVVLEEGDEVPKFLNDIEATSVAKNGFNRVAIGLAYENKIDYPLFLDFKPEKNHEVPGSVELLYTKIEPLDMTRCEIRGNGELLETSAVSFVRFSIADVFAGMESTNRVNFVISRDINDIPDNLELKCNVSAVVRIDGNKVYSKPTKFFLTLPLKFKNSRLGDEMPGERYVSRINEYEDNTRLITKTIGVLNSVYVTLQDLCNIKGSLQGFGKTFSLTQMVGAQIANSPAGNAVSSIQKVGETIADTSSTYKDFVQKISSTNTDLQRLSFSEENFPSSYDLTIDNLLTQSCEMVTCSIDAQDDKTGFNLNGEETAKDYLKISSDDSDNSFFSGMGNDALNGIVEGIDVPDVKESLISAVTARCLPAIVYHFNKYKQMSCQTLTCMKTQAAYGTDISVCEQAKAQYVCESVTGEFFDLGGARQVKNMMDNTNAYVQNIIPNTLKSIFKNSYCEGYATLSDKFIGSSVQNDGLSKTDKLKIGLCTIPEVIANQMNYARQTTQSKKQFSYTPEEDACQMAYCDSINPEDCNAKGTSFIKQWFNFKTPVSTLSMLRGSNGRYEFITPTAPTDLTLTPEEFSNRDKGIAKRNLDLLKAINPDDLTPAQKEQIKILDEELTARSDDKVTDVPLADVFNKKAEVQIDPESLAGMDQAQKDAITRNAEKYYRQQENYLSQIEQYKVDKMIEQLSVDPNNRAEIEKIQQEIDRANEESNKAKQAISQLTDKNGNINVNTIIEMRRGEFEQKQEQIYNLVDTGVGLLISKGYMNWASLASYDPDTVAGGISEWSDTWLNSDNYKNKICSATFIKPKDESTLKGAAIQCKQNYCQPVLTQAVEKITLENGSILYTATYALGNIKEPSEFALDRTIKYNIYFKKNGQSIKLFNTTWLEVRYRETDGNTFAFPSKNDYDEMCVVFEEDFPPAEIGKKKEYCRKIVDATLDGNSDFDTGLPSVKEEEKVGKVISTNSPNLKLNKI